ncbi:hypothetical protein V7793_13455 [Streptomyces sp. KLMMK]
MKGSPSIVASHQVALSAGHSGQSAIVGRAMDSGFARTAARSALVANRR